MRRLMSWVAFVVLGIVVVSLIGGFYLTEVALHPTVERDAALCYASFEEKYPSLSSWGKALQEADNLQEVTLTAHDGTSLGGYLIKADSLSDRTAVVVHGYTDHPFGMLQIGWIYHQMGYNVLLPSLRYHGNSGGCAIQMGWGDRLDVKQWIDHLPTLMGSEQQVVVHGISMGAATTMMLAGETDLSSAVRCFVEDCGYTSVWDQFRKELHEDYHLPTFPILYAANLICRVRFGWGFKEASPIEAVGRTERPMLFIHGSEDRYVPTAMVYPLYEAKAGNETDKALWIAPDSRHACSFADHPEEYTRQVEEFVSRYIAR